MRPTTPWRSGWFGFTRCRRILFGAGLGTPGLLLGGCILFTPVGAAIAVALLTGIFIGSIATTFVTTPLLLGYVDTGSVQLEFSEPHDGRTTFLRYQGRLPGFHFAIISTSPGKATVAAQGQGSSFETDVEIDFSVSPTAITGTIREVGGDGEFDLQELYRVTSITPSLTDPDEGGNRTLVLTILADSLTDGGELEYALTLQTDLNRAGDSLVGTVQVTRELTIGDEVIVIESETGSLEMTKEDEQPPEDNANQADENENAAENDNVDQVENENAADEADTNGVEPGEENTNQNADDSLPDTPAGCVADLSDLDPTIADAIKILLGAGQEAFDRDDDGEVTPAEVEQTIDGTLALLGFSSPLTDEENQCVADVLNR